jgi:endonuclease/exonuclease/phosphatase family metal-dependent hydrolase
MRSFLDIPIRLLTHNIRYATTSPFKGEELWPIRAPRMLNELQFNTRHNPEAFICLQEVLHGQLVDIMTGLNPSSTKEDISTLFSHRQSQQPSYQPSPDPALPSILVDTNPSNLESNITTTPEWSYIGVGRDDGKQAGEYSPIIYRPAVWQLLRFETIWLTETPWKPSKYPGAGSVRILTIGIFAHRRTRRRLVAMNTHLDDQSSPAREFAAKTIQAQVARFEAVAAAAAAGAEKQQLPVFVAGDFNSETGEEAYSVMTAEAARTYDLRGRVAEAERYGDNNTFTGFGFDELKRIDFLFLDLSPVWKVDGYAVLDNKFEDGVYNSDHRAVVGDVTMQSL